VDELEVRRVDGVLADLLDGGGDAPFVAHLLGHARLGELRIDLDIEQRSDVVRVVPGPDHPVGFAHRVAVDHRLALADLRQRLGVGDVPAPALGVIAPAVERTADQGAVHRAAVAQVRAEVRTVGVEHADLALRIAEHHQVAGEVAQRPDLADGQLIAIADEVPPIGNGVGKTLRYGHWCAPPVPPASLAPIS
jgi:hypothetical protein